MNKESTVNSSTSFDESEAVTPPSIECNVAVAARILFTTAWYWCEVIVGRQIRKSTKELGYKG